MNTEKKAGDKHSFGLPPRRPPATAEEFIAGAGQPHPGPASAAAVPATAVPKAEVVSRLPWEGADDSKRVQRQPYRLTDKEFAALNFIIQNKPGFRSTHAYVLDAVLQAMTRDLKGLTGETIEFAALAPATTSGAGS